MVCLDTDFLIEFDRQQPQAVSRMEEMAVKRYQMAGFVYARNLYRSDF